MLLSFVLQAYQTSSSHSLESSSISTMVQLWRAHSEVAHHLQSKCHTPYKELSTALVLASRSRVVLQELGREEQVQPLELPGRMVAAAVTAEQGLLPASWATRERYACSLAWD